MGLQLRREPSKKVHILSTLIVVATLVAQPAYGFISAQVAHAITTTNVVVTPDDLQGWTGVDDNGNGGSLNYVAGPVSAPLGSGSAQLKVTDSNQGYMIFKSDLGGTKLSDLSALSYKTYIQSGNNLVAPALQVNIDRDTTDGNTGWQGRLVYEPYMNGSVNDGQWQTWDASAGKWWLTKSALFDNQCGQGSPCTLSELVALFPNVGINGGVNAGFGFKAGSSWTNFTGNVDAFVINNKTYDFEPVSAPSGLKFTATNLNNTNVSGCDVATNNADVVAHWDARGTKYNYRSWTNAAGSAYNSEATAYVSSNLGTNSQVGALNQGEGDYWFEVQTVMDNGDLSFWSNSCKVTYDKATPAAPTLVSPANSDRVKGASVTQSWANGGSTDVDHYVYESYNNANLTSLRWREDINSTSKTANNVANATYWWRVKAVDHAGNSSPWSEVRKLTVDNTKPTADLKFLGIGSSAKSFKVKFSESMNPIDVINPANYFLHNWPGGGMYESLVGDATVGYDEATTTATVTFTNPAWYVSAEQNWGVRNIHDLAGNEITETSEYSTPMNGPLFGALTINENHNVLTWGWMASDPEMTNGEGVSGASGVKEYEYRLLRGSDVVVDWTGTTANSAVTTATEDGDYSFELKARDNAGNESGLVTITAHLDTTAPVLTMDAPVLNSDGSYTVHVTTDDPTSPVSFYLDGTLLTGATSNSSKTVWTVTTAPLNAEETHTISAKSSDPSGNEASDAEQFTVPPVTNTPLGTNLVPSAITQPAIDFATIFTQPLTQQAQTEDDDTGVLGAETKKEGTDIVPVSATPQGWRIFGIAWYWILLTIVVLGSAAWWGIATARRRAAQDV